MSYKLTPIDPNSDLQYVIRLADECRIPNFQDNPDYQEYLEWVAAGNTAAEADPIEEIPVPEGGFPPPIM